MNNLTSILNTNSSVEYKNSQYVIQQSTSQTINMTAVEACAQSETVRLL